MKDQNHFRAIALRAAITAALGLAAAPQIQAQDAPAADEDMSEVVVTGTRVATRSETSPRCSVIPTYCTSASSTGTRPGGAAARTSATRASIPASVQSTSSSSP